MQDQDSLPLHLLLNKESMESSKSALVHCGATSTSLLESHLDISSTVIEPGWYSSLKESSQLPLADKNNNNFEFHHDTSSSSSSTLCQAGSSSTQWHAILSGQLLSVALTISSATSLALNSTNSSSSSSSTSNSSSACTGNIISTSPTLSLFCMYLLLAILHFTYWLYCQRQERKQAITSLILSNLTSAVDCSLDEAYPTLADKRHSSVSSSSSSLLFHCNTNTNNTSNQNSVMMKIAQKTDDDDPPQTIDMELELEKHLPVSRYKFLQVCCSSSSASSSSSWFTLNLYSYSWKQYCALAILHVQGNYCLLKSFQYESFKTVILLQSISIPAAMITSAMFLRRHYTYLHILGAILCIFGSALTFRDSIFTSSASNSNVSNRGTTTTSSTTTSTTETVLVPNPIIGDLLAICSAILSGISDVFAEQAVKYKGSIVEYLAMIGFFGTITSFLQVLLSTLASPYFGYGAATTTGGSETETSSSHHHLLLLSVFTFFSYMYYAGMSRFLLFSEATFLNLSMLSTDLWSIGFSIVHEQMFPSLEFFLSFITITAGVVAYQKAPSPIITDKDGEIELDEHHHHHEDIEEN